MPRGRSKTVSDAEIIDVARAISDPCFTPKEVAADLPIGKERTRQYLNALVDDGVLGRKAVGSGHAYWIKQS